MYEELANDTYTYFRQNDVDRFQRKLLDMKGSMTISLQQALKKSLRTRVC